MNDKAAIDALTIAFFDAFTNRDGQLPGIDRLYDIFVPEARIFNNAGGEPVVYDVAGFVEPRRALLSGGSLTNFREAEVSERTEIFGRVAHRFSVYEKSWTSEGKHYAGRGAKTIQFVRTAQGWKISSLAWDDEPASAAGHGAEDDERLGARDDALR